MSCGCSQKSTTFNYSKPYIEIAPKQQVRPPSSLSLKKTLVIAVIDTGFAFEGKGVNAHLCKFGHKDFSNSKVYAKGFKTTSSVPLDNHGHGTHIAGLIDQYASKGNRAFCLIILKYYDPNNSLSSNSTVEATIEAINYAKNIKADVINYSGGGVEFIGKEAEAVKDYIDQGGVFIAAAGNEGKDLDQQHYYPALDDSRVISVGNVNENGMVVKSSNFGSKVSCFEMGYNVSMYGMFMTGTSQATAIATGKFVAGMPCGKK